ncbi:MAG: DUF423 domain-containing protein [Steroidobacteraceae bacterium]
MRQDSSLGRLPVVAGAALLALATIAGAVGAHALPHDWSAQRVHIFNIAVRYQFFQSLGLLAMGVWLGTRNLEALTSPQRLRVQRCASVSRTLLAGIVLFCGSLYGLALQAPRWVGLVTPLGGALLIVAWGVFAVEAWRS